MWCPVIWVKLKPKVWKLSSGYLHNPEIWCLRWNGHIVHLSRSHGLFSFTSRPASTVSFKIAVSSWLSVLLPFTWEFDCSNGEQQHTAVFPACSEDCLLPQTKPFYALNLTKPACVGHLPLQRHCSCVSLPSQLSDHMVSMHLPKQSLPHARGSHTPAMQALLWVQNLFFTSPLVKPFPESFLLLTRSGQDFLSPTFDKIKQMSVVFEKLIIKNLVLL